MGKSGIFNVQAQKLLDQAYGKTVYTPPDEIYIGLSTTKINPDGTGITEPVAASYAGVVVTNGAAMWDAAVLDTGEIVKRNKVAVEFPEAEQDWGVVTHWFTAVNNAGSPGALMDFAPLTPNRDVKIGDPVIIRIGDMEISLVPEEDV